jgi:hypothetical protein
MPQSYSSSYQNISIEDTPPKASPFDQRYEIDTLDEPEEPKYDENVILRSKKKPAPNVTSPNKFTDTPPKPELVVNEDMKKYNKDMNRPSRRMDRNSKAHVSTRVNIFKELEQFEEEAEIIENERSPSPSLRPDHPMNKPSFFKRDGKGVTSRKPKTLASVLERKNKVQENSGSSKTERRSNIVAPKVIVKKDLDEPYQSTGIPKIKNTSYYNQAIFNQKK